VDSNEEALHENAGVPYLTAEQVAERLQVSVRVVYERIGDGSLRALNVGTLQRPIWRISEEALERFEQERSSGS
jgi:excisionase family DNA binding protein